MNKGSMWLGPAAALLWAAADGPPRSAWAMDRAGDGRWCQVEGAAQLPAELNGAGAVCSIFEAHLGKFAPRAVTVRVRSPFLVKADVTAADGRRLPTVTVGSSDRPLGARSLRMLARAVAAELGAGQQQQGRE